MNVMFVNNKHFPSDGLPRLLPMWESRAIRGHFPSSFPTKHRTKTAAERTKEPNPPQQVALQHKQGLSTIQMIQPQRYWLHLTVFK